MTEPDSQYESDSVITVPNLPSAGPIAVEKGEKYVNVLQKIERKLGIPISKLMTFDDMFKWNKLEDGQDFKNKNRLNFL